MQSMDWYIYWICTCISDKTQSRLLNVASLLQISCLRIWPSDPPKLYLNDWSTTDEFAVDRSKRSSEFGGFFDDLDRSSWCNILERFVVFENMRLQSWLALGIHATNTPTSSSASDQTYTHSASATVKALSYNRGPEWEDAAYMWCCLQSQNEPQLEF